MGLKAHRPASGAMVNGADDYLTAAGAAGEAGVAGDVPPISCIHIVGSKGLLAGAGALRWVTGAGAVAGAGAAWVAIGKNGIGAACAGAGDGAGAAWVGIAKKGIDIGAACAGAGADAGAAWGGVRKNGIGVACAGAGAVFVGIGKKDSGAGWIGAAGLPYPP